MSGEGDMALAALSHWGVASLGSFRRALDPSPGVSGESRFSGRNRTPRLLESLGHCVVDYHAGTIAISPSTLARLPVRGLPKAVVCGLRTPDLVHQVQQEGKMLARRVVMRFEPQARPFAPQRIVAEGESVADLQQLGRRVGLHVPLEPAALSLLGFSATLEEYEAQLEWRRDPEIGWYRRDFDPDRLFFTSAIRREDVRLSSYLDPVRLQWRHYLWRGSEVAACDRNWGRYALLRQLGRRVLAYDARTHWLSAPVSVPLPPLLARALTLCTGLAPRIVYPVGDDGHTNTAAGVEVFVGVSQGIADQVATKVGQALAPDIQNRAGGGVGLA